MELNKAIMSFSDWEHPWEFENFVSALLSENDKGRFNSISRAANDKDNWLQAGLVLGCKIAHKSLREKFSELEEESIASIVRAASYQWR